MNAFPIAGSALLTPLGNGIEQNIQAVQELKRGMKTGFFPGTLLSDFPLAGFTDEEMAAMMECTQTRYRFDALVLSLVEQLKKEHSIDWSSPETLIILSTTKGDIECLGTAQERDSLLTTAAEKIQHAFATRSKVHIISNACISGISACIYATRMLSTSAYRQACIIGCDVLSEFVSSGFHSFHALSKDICRPFDAKRDGINLGEAAAALILKKDHPGSVFIGAGFITNDANHISGPSKTGDELAFAIHQSLNEWQVEAGDLSFISAHGTATLYNDEMESKAYSGCGLSRVPVFSLKGNYGHTLGASGVLEIVLSAEALQRGIILPSCGFDEAGVSGSISINQKVHQSTQAYALKTASGFGGCNASILLHRSEAL